MDLARLVPDRRPGAAVRTVIDIKVANCVQMQPVFHRFLRLARGKVIPVTVPTVIEVLDAALEELPDGSTLWCVRSLRAGSRAVALSPEPVESLSPSSRPAPGTLLSPHATQPV